MFYGVPVWIIPGLLRAISAEALGTRLPSKLLQGSGDAASNGVQGGGGVRGAPEKWRFLFLYSAQNPCFNHTTIILSNEHLNF
jgi:hypothetical protein